MSDSSDFGVLARFLMERHGFAAVHYADRAIAELEQRGDPARAQAWRTLRDLLIGMARGAAVPKGATIH